MGHWASSFRQNKMKQYQAFILFLHLLISTVCFLYLQQVGAGGVPIGAKTSEFYRTENVPNRFENPGR